MGQFFLKKQSFRSLALLSVRDDNEKYLVYQKTSVRIMVFQRHFQSRISSVRDTFTNVMSLLIIKKNYQNMLNL